MGGLTAETQERGQRHQLPRLDLHSDWAFLLAAVLAAAIGAVYVAEGVRNWNLLDMSAYQEAASRLAEGGVLYGGDVHHNSAYRYAPWFAHAWIPLNQLPEAVVRFGWSTLLLAGAFLAIRPLLRWSRPHLVLLLLFGPLMFGSASGGNVQPLMIGVLVWGLPTRLGWLAVAFAASLKLIPLVFCAVFIAERRWLQAFGAVALTALLWSPVLGMRVDPVTFDTGLASMLPAPFWLVVPALAGMAALVFAVRQSRWTALVAALAGVAALPRLFVYELSILLPAVPSRRRE